MQWHNLGDQLSKIPKGHMLVNFKAITNADACTLPYLSKRRRRKSISWSGHWSVRNYSWLEGDSAPSLAFQHALHHIDLPAASSLVCRWAQAIFPHLKVFRTGVGKASKTKLKTSSGLVPSSSCPLPFPSNKRDVLNKMKASRFPFDVLVLPKKNTHTYIQSRGQGQGFHLIQKVALERFALINYTLLCKSSRQHDTCYTVSTNAVENKLADKGEKIAFSSVFLLKLIARSVLVYWKNAEGNIKICTCRDPNVFDLYFIPFYF